MRSAMKLVAVAMLGGAAAACSGGDTGEPAAGASAPPTLEQDLTLALRGARRDVAPSMLVVEGRYSDVRFVDMMAAHHRGAIEMSEVAVVRAEHDELRGMAQTMIAAQQQEIDDLRGIKRDLTGDDHLPRRSHPDEMENSGVPPVRELERATPFDRAFIDGMLPHHAGAIRMASVALRRSRDAQILAMSQRIVDAQAKEIGELTAMRERGYGRAP